MSIRELDLISRAFKNPRDAVLVTDKLSFTKKDLKREATPFIQRVEKTAKLKRLTNVILIAILYDPEKIDE